MSIVRHNLMDEAGYMPYCGNGTCMRRARFNGKQFECKPCRWQSGFELEFIEQYQARWAEPALKGQQHDK